MFSIIPSALVGGIVYKRLNRSLKILFWFILVSIVWDAMSYYCYLRQLSNMALLNLYPLVQFGFIALIYFFISEKKYWKISILIMSLILYLFSVYTIVIMDDIMIFNSLQRYVEGIIVITICIGYYVQILRQAEYMYLEKTPFFWLTSGYLVYFSGTLLLFLFARLIFENDPGGYHWNIRQFLQIGLNMIYVVTFWLGCKKLTS